LKCNYLDKDGFCKAIPSSDANELENLKYKPNEDELKTYCTNTMDMQACPRLHIYHDYLEALRKK
jgi:hypothetical protein